MIVWLFKKKKKIFYIFYVNNYPSDDSMYLEL